MISRLSVRVAWGDCDPAGIVFYPTYFRWMDAATWALFEAAGYAPPRIRAEGWAMPLVSAECQFLAPAEPGTECAIATRVVRLGGKSLVLEHEVARADGAPLARGRETRVWSRFSSGPGSALRSEPWPDDLRARLQPREA